MTGARVEVTGVNEMVRDFKRLGLKTRDLSRAFDAIAAEIVTDAKSMAPKVTGRLAGDVRAGRAKTKASVSVGRKSVPYAGPINYGWRRRNIEPTMFLNRAADQNANSAVTALRLEMQRQINSVGLG
jgi:hypothetical protein